MGKFDKLYLDLWGIAELHTFWGHQGFIDETRLNMPPLTFNCL